MRVVIASFVIAAGCSSAKPPSCHDRVAAMAGHLAAPRSLAELNAKPTAPMQIAQQLVPAVRSCKAAADVFGGIGNLEGGVDKRTYLRDKLPPTIEACGCSASPETVGPLVEQLFDAWSAPAAP